MPAPANPILDGRLSIGQAQSTIRFSVVDQQLDPIGRLSPLAASSITSSAESSVKRKLTGMRIGEDVLRDLNPFTDLVKPWLILGDGTEWPLGVFAFTDLPRHVSTFVDMLDATMLDQSWKLDQKAGRRYSLPPQGRVLDLVKLLLDSVGIMEINRDLPEDNDTAVFEAVGWTESTHKLKIIDECAQLMSCLPLYFDNAGRAVVRPWPDMRRVTADISYRLENSRMEAGTLITNDHLLTAPNVYRVIGSGVASGGIVGEARVDPDLPWSVEKRGFELVEVTEMQGLTSTAQAEQIAQTQAAAGSGYKTFEFEAQCDPRHDLFSLVEVDGEVWRELSWSLALRPGGKMSHELTSGGFPVAG